jgi:hypothetical protein
MEQQKDYLCEKLIVMKQAHSALTLIIGVVFGVALTVYFFSGDVHWYPAIFGSIGTIGTIGASIWMMKKGK